jgi:molybdopterin synthase catalytic subunit
MPGFTEFTLLLFGTLKDAAGAAEIKVKIADNLGIIEITDVLTHCAEQYPRLAPWLPHVRVAVNYEYVKADHVVRPEDEIAFIPPVAGGAQQAA